MDMNVLPVFESVAATWRAIRREGTALIAALAIPAVCISVLEFLSQDFPSRFPYTLLSWALAAPFYVLFAVICHRSVILGGASLPNRLGLFWSERETRFLGWTIAIIVVTWVLGIGVTLLALLSPLPPIVTLVVVWLAFVYLYVRLAMVFPATAVEDDASFERAWFLTGGNGFRIIGVIAFSVGPIILALAVFFYLFGSDAFLWYVIEEISSHVVMLISVCALSVSYRELIDFETSALPE